MVNLLSLGYIGIPLNYLAVGVVNGGLQTVANVCFYHYFNMQSYTANAGVQMMSMAWSFKMFIGMVSDSFPIMGYNRKYYIMGGWTICSLVMLIAAFFMPVCDPYYVPGTQTVQNENAPTEGMKYIWIFAIANFSFLFADVSTDGFVTELAQREPLLKRGTTQTMAQVWRFMAMAGSNLFIALLMNSPVYGGDFSYGLPLNTVFGIVGGISLLPAIAAFFLNDTKVSDKIAAQQAALSHYNEAGMESGEFKQMTFGERMRQLWRILQQRAVWQVACFQFFSVLLSDITPANANDVQYVWAMVQPLQASMMNVIGYCLFSLGLYIVKRYLLNTSWRMMILVSLSCINILDCFTSMFTIFDVIRNPYFFVGPGALQQLANGIFYISGSFVSVEVCDPGFEATTYGLLTTVHNLAIPLAVLIGNQVGGVIGVTKADVKADSEHTRWMVAAQYFIYYGLVIVSFLTLFILPKNKVETQKLKKNGGSSALYGGLVFGFMFICLLYSTLIAILSMLPSTYCLPLVGGQGC